MLYIIYIYFIKSLYLCVICINFKVSTVLQIVVHKLFNVKDFANF